METWLYLLLAFWGLQRYGKPNGDACMKGIFNSHIYTADDSINTTIIM